MARDLDEMMKILRKEQRELNRGSESTTKEKAVKIGFGLLAAWGVWKIWKGMRNK